MHKKILALALASFLCTISFVQAAQVLFTPALVLSEEHTDNLYLDYENEVDDYITAAGLDLTGQILWRTAGIELNYSPTYNAYTDNDDLNYWRHLANLSTWKVFARNTRVELRDTYLRTNDPTDESPTIELDGQPQAPDIGADRNRRGRNEYETNVAEARLTHQFGANDNVYVAYQYSTLRDIDPPDGADVNDNDIATPSMGIVYNFSPSWGVEFDASYANSIYVDQADRGEYNGNIRLLHRFNRALSGYVNYQHTVLDYEQDAEEDYSISEPSIGIRYDFQDNARIEIGAGYYVQDYETSEDQEGFNITSDMYKRWTYRTGYFGISGASGYVIDDNGTEDNGLNIYYLAGVEAGYNFNARLTGSVHGSYRYDEYPNDTPERVENTLTTGLGLDWQALQWMVIRLSYDHSDVSSDIETDEYTENRAMLTIRIAPSTPYRLN